MTPHRILNGILGVLLAYNASFFALHLSGQSRLWKDALSDVQALLSIMELIAVIALVGNELTNVAGNWTSSMTCSR